MNIKENSEDVELNRQVTRDFDSLRRSVRRFIRRNKTTIFKVMFALAFCGLVGVYALSENAEIFLTHVAAGVVAVIIVTFLVERPIESYQSNLHRFSPSVFLAEIKLAHKSVKILDIWMKTVLLDGDSDLFRAAIFEAVQAGAKVQIAVAAPNSECARQRAEELCRNADEFNGKDPAYVQALMERAILILRELVNSVNLRFCSGIDHQNCPVEIRVFNADAELAMHRVDEIAYWNHYLKDRVALDGMQYRTRTDFGPAEYLTQHFIHIWNHEGSLDIGKFVSR